MKRTLECINNLARIQLGATVSNADPIVTTTPSFDVVVLKQEAAALANMTISSISNFDDERYACFYILICTP